MQKIRNFSIIAHVDHGKSTLADRLIQYCGGLTEREMKNQVLDSMDLERERGITIKSQSVNLNYTAKNNQIYQLNCIDTPGHVDFSYEVSRSLAACEGVLLVIDSTQGVEAQSIANATTAMNLNLEILVVLNKIDLPSAEPERVLNEVQEIIGLDTTDAIYVSAKTGLNIDLLLEKIITKIPSPSGVQDAPLRALIIDSWFDNYMGVISLVRIVDGALSKGAKIRVMNTGRDYLVDRVGVFKPVRHETKILDTGAVGYINAGIKELGGAPVGDTITLTKNPAVKALVGFKKTNPNVFTGMYPVDSSDYESLREALKKLRLNDSALYFEPETSQALGFGFRCGFLGMLHMEIIQERLEREYNLCLIITAPTVIYEVATKDGQSISVDNPAKLPSIDKIQEIREPIIYAEILLPNKYLGKVMTLCIGMRGVHKQLKHVNNQVVLGFELPMNEVILDFFDCLQSASRGYASFDYHFLRFEASRLVKMDILINGDKVDALSSIVHQEQSQVRGHTLTKKIKEFIPRQMFDIAIQAAIGSRVISRESVKALRKNVTAKCYGGDISRKRKLLDKQKAGKKRMKQIGSVSIPQDAFMAILHVRGKNK